MNLAIDCRYIGKSGIGRVLEGILDSIDYSLNHYYLVGDSKYISKYNATIIEDYTEPYSKNGLLKFNKSINKTCDAIIIPNFLVPYGIKIPVYSIMHDLIFLDLPKITTRNFIDYSIKKHLLKRCVKKSKKIFCDSIFTKNRCLHFYKKYKNKFELNYIGLSKQILEYVPQDKVEKENTIIFVGNVKPHKGIDTLIEAFANVTDKSLKLKVVGEKDKFLTNAKLKEAQNIVFTGRISDDDLMKEIGKAKYLVLPSKYEGFGLPPLEAIILNTQPIVSNIEVFKEVYEGLPVKLFDTIDELTKMLEEEPEANVSSFRNSICEKYNYKNTAQKIIDVIGGDLNG